MKSVRRQNRVPKGYLAIFEKAKGGGYGVWFPDIDGCTSGGEDLKTARRQARLALKFWLEDARNVPGASSLTFVRRKFGQKNRIEMVTFGNVNPAKNSTLNAD